jgi:hypothetical protein
LISNVNKERLLHIAAFINPLLQQIRWWGDEISHNVEM